MVLALGHVHPQRTHDAPWVHSAMVVEAFVFRGDDGLPQGDGYVGEVAVSAVLLRVELRQDLTVAIHDHRGLVTPFGLGSGVRQVADDGGIRDAAHYEQEEEGEREGDGDDLEDLPALRVLALRSPDTVA